MMTPMTSAASTPSPLENHDLFELSPGALSEWQQDQFERHLRYARSIGLSPGHSHRYARQQLHAAEIARPHPAVSQAAQ